MPRPKPRGYYWSHPWPQRYKRVLYVAMAGVAALGHVGSSQLLGADGAAPVLFAMACGLCLVGAVRVCSRMIWLASGLTMFAAWMWRLGQILIISAGWTSQEPPDSAAMATAAYIFCCLTVWPAWHWLRPRAANE